MTLWNGLELPPAYYEDDAVYIINADCREVLPLIPDKSIDLVLTDPPYGVGKAEWDKKFNMFWMKKIAPITRNSIAIMPGNANLLKLPYKFNEFTYKWTLSFRILNALVRGAVGFGNWIPCVIYARDAGSIYTCNQDVGEGSIVGDMPKHPSPKPHEAISWMIERLPKGLILDPFLGSGTTAYCAKKLGRKCIGIEIEEKYCEIAAKRCSQSVMKLEIQ
jgi:site-specific DNA-methyltransferase (adenine-specific)